MKTARYFLIPESHLQEYTEYNNQFSAYRDAKQDDMIHGKIAVVKLIKEKPHRNPEVTEAV